jgi:hypothetical protein
VPVGINHHQPSAAKLDAWNCVRVYGPPFLNLVEVSGRHVPPRHHRHLVPAAGALDKYEARWKYWESCLREPHRYRMVQRSSVRVGGPTWKRQDLRGGFNGLITTGKSVL